MADSPAHAAPEWLPAHVRAVLAVATAVVLWGMSSVAIKSVSPSGVVTAFYRLWFAIPLLWMIPVVRPAMRRHFDRRGLAGCALGGTLFCLHQALFFTALKLTSIANVTIIGALQPVVVLLLAGPLFNERATRASLVWAALAFGGTALVVIGARATPAWSLYGDALAFANLFAFSAYFLASKRVRATVGAWEYVIGMTTVSGGWMLAAVVVTGQDLGAPHGWEWLVLLAIAVFPGTLGHVLINWSHAHASALAVSIMLLAVPLVAAVGAAVFLGERIVPLQMVGGGIVLAAIAVVVRSAAPATGDALAQSAAETDAP
jgi:drug/metabolite transporter (DMT)-like permease